MAILPSADVWLHPDVRPVPDGNRDWGALVLMLFPFCMPHPFVVSGPHSPDVENLQQFLDSFLITCKGGDGAESTAALCGKLRLPLFLLLKRALSPTRSP